MTEIEFINALDHSFRFTKKDEHIFLSMIQIACSWSENAALMAGFMLAIGEGSKNRRLRLLNYLSSCYPSSIMRAIHPIIHALIRSRPVSSADIVHVLGMAKGIPGVYNALCIIHLADPRREAEINEIITRWEHSQPTTNAES